MHEIVERAQRFLDRRPRVGDVLIIQVDIISAETAQAGLDLAQDVATRGTLKAARGVHRAGEFGRQHDVLAAIAEDLAEARLGAAARVAIGVGFVEECDAEVERLVDDLAGRCEIDAAAKIIAAEAYHRDLQAGLSEISLFHPFPRSDQSAKVAKISSSAVS